MPTPRLRPMGKVRRLVPHLRRARRKPAAGAAPVVAAPEAAPEPGPFASRARLPLAVLLPRRGDGQPAVLGGALQRWLEARWLWFRPRAIPLLVAFMGLVGVLNARSYLIALARYGTPTVTQRAADLPGTIHEVR
ncbi:MAG TPA: hypothetical protein VGC42_28840 [Kofleriaceae bacterium]